jgi:hypothetical protein
MFSEEQRAMIRRDNESWHDHYKRVDKMRLAVVVEQSKPRCVNCAALQGQTCNTFKTPVADEFLFAPNDCPSFDNDQIPF